MISKSENRSTKSEGNPKSEAQKKKPSNGRLSFYDFVLRASFGFRISDFGFPRVAASLLLAASLALTGCSTNVTRANFDRIQPGMTRAEVEAILGPAHQSYQTILSWKTNHEKTVITVVLDDQGRVDSKNAEGM